MKTVVILPTYNERENIGIIVPLIFSSLLDATILVVDDNSPDGTAEIVRGLQKKYNEKLGLIVRSKKAGLGPAYINGFNVALGDKDVSKIIMMDSDLSHNPKYLTQMIEKSIDYDVVVGSRYVIGGETEGWEFWRRLLSYFGNLYCRIITRLPIYDCTAGFNVINANILRKVDFSKLDLSGYAFIMELKFALYRLGARFYEVPIKFVNRKGGESKMSGHIINEGIIAPWKILLRK